ncbi:MAG TPA: DUF2905 domain-containing protein [Thermoanaerobaculia bacterium]
MSPSRLLIVAGMILIAAGLLFPLLARLGIGRLPGDVLLRRGNATFYFPIVTCIILSIVLTLLMRLFRR